MSLGVRYELNGSYASVQDTVTQIMAATLDDARTLLSRRPFDKLFSLTLEPALN